MAGYVPVLLITANVGSIFEEPGVMLNVWTEEFLATIARLDPKFIALHCQEVGGKNYEQSMRHVEYFVRLLMSSEELRLFDKVRVFLDEDFSSAEHFTALGNFYFIHESLKDVLLWDFKESSFSPVSGKDVHSGNIEAVTTKEKAKFPQDFFPECKWSRKGFLRTRWSINGTVFDLINIHLFHDASNFVAMETFPSVYSKTRRRALEHTLDRFHNDQYPNVPYFLFGDFNFRTDTAGVIKKLTEDTQESKLPSKNNFSKLQFHNKDDHLILTLGKKEFSHFEHQDVFMKNSGQWLREYDRELEDFEGRLLEYPINFLPSYPFEENIDEGSNYMQTRVPAWCDRVLLSPTAKTLAPDASASDAVEYGIIGPTTCMGDHKPVYLRIVLLSEAGTVNCCELANAPQYCFKVPDSYVDRLSMLPDCRSYNLDSKQSHIDNSSSNLLHAAPIKHDPYTPDSMDSPSPCALVVPGEALPDLESLDDYDTEIGYDQSAPRFSTASKRLDTAVSPALLKSKLELIVQSKTQQRNCNFRKNVVRMKKIEKSPSDCDLYYASTDDKSKSEKRREDEEDDSEIGTRTSRSNSDVSWQRSQLLTRAWVQGKGHQAYDNFRSDLDNRKSLSSLKSLDMKYYEGGTDMVIPKIAIINASNFESNASSVHINDDRHSAYSEARLSTYSDNRTKTISGEASSLEKSDEICSRIYDESDYDGRTRFCDNVKEVFNERNHSVEDSSINNDRDRKRLSELDIDSLTDDMILKPEDRSYKDTKSISRDNNNKYVSKDKKDETFITDKKLSTDVDSSKAKRYEKNGASSEEEKLLVTTAEKCNVEEKYVVVDNLHSSSSGSSTKASVIPNIYESDTGNTANAINDSLNTYGSINAGLPNETETACKSETRNEVLASLNTTRSNSTQSQDGNIRLGITARKVTEKCKNDIVREKGKCRRCCCVLS
ncbi:uncharacterized protein LOC124302407 isoform X1 [Neodiprion virginianus]|uniref:uncharacterized protein LOC124302407 isoform X1 n=2 Tax=Neodiprion virginianus TaxID=2961670 RepID=UPI001EE71C7C|nr:uncharacterized protein LOC124302407 isoform X1 [Neodiprion virginianus]